MNEGLEGLADSVLQVTSTSFDTPMTTEWKADLSRSYRHKLHGLPFDQHDELCDKIDETAKNLKSTRNAVTYAMFLIDLRIKYDDNEEKRLASSLLRNIENDSIVKELETVLEDDSVSLPPTSTKLPPTFTKFTTYIH